MTTAYRGLLGIFFFAMLLVAAPVLASGPGVVTSAAYRDPPPGFAILVGVFDDSDLNLSIKGQFEEALKSQGQLIDPSGRLRLMLETETVNERQVSRQNPFGGGTVRGAGDPNYGAWQPPEEQIFGSYERRTVVGYIRYFHIRAVLRDPDDNQIIWEGNVFFDLDNARPRSVAPAMIRELASVFGQTVRRREFSY